MSKRLAGALASVVLVSSVFVAPAHAAGATRYHVVAVPSAQAASAVTAAINQKGVAAGNYQFHATLFDQQGGMTDLGVLPGGYFSTAFGLNAKGQAVGYSVANLPTPFLWFDGQMSALPLLPKTTYPAGFARAINKSGEIVGDSGAHDGRTHPVTWKKGRIAALPLLAGTDSGSATAINVAGDVVGTSGSRPVLWSGGQPVDLLAGTNYPSGYAAGINDGGQIVGQAWAPLTSTTSAPQAFLYDHGQITILGLLNPSDYNSVAHGIDAQGVVVGESGAHAFVWSGGLMTQLDTLLDDASAGWTLVTAVAISPNGQITGMGRIGNNPSVAYIATPVAE